MSGASNGKTRERSEVGKTEVFCYINVVSRKSDQDGTSFRVCFSQNDLQHVCSHPQNGNQCSVVVDAVVSVLVGTMLV